MQRPKVVNKRRTAQYDIDITRPSKWSNPFSHLKRSRAAYLVANRQEAIECYQVWVQEQTELMAALPELAGKTLACVCKPLGCHGDILGDLVERLQGENSTGRTQRQIRVSVHPGPLSGDKTPRGCWKTVTASVRGGLAVHLTINLEEALETPYTVTHIPTGMAIGMTDTEEQAERVCGLLEETLKGAVDWEKVTDHDPKLWGCKGIVKEIFVEVVGRFVRCGDGVERT